MSGLARIVGRGVPEQKAASEQKSISLTDPEAFPLFGVVPVASGVTVTAQSAMRVPAVRRAVSLIAESVATLPFKTYHADKETAKDHPSYGLVHDWSNDWTSAKDFREQLTTDALLRGHGFAQVARNSEGKPVFLLRMDPAAVDVETDDFGEPSYRIRLKNGGETILPHHDVLHIHAGGGASPISHAREAIGLAVASEQHLAGFFKNGGRPSGVIRHPEKLDADTLKKLTGSWFNTHGGEQAGKTAILDEGMEFQEIALKLADAEFSEVRREQVREVARAFGVPPALLYETSRATWSNFEQSHRDFITNTLRPWIGRWEAAYTRVLLSPEERSRFYIEAITNDIMSADLASRATFYSQFRSTGVLSINEIRALENLPPVPGGDTRENPFTTTGAAPAPKSEDQPTNE